ncbi:hypothetical protein A2U01_0094900, partial [Trifolium medium]|nr:hypothetical protein [Trifolium medium]
RSGRGFRIGVGCEVEDCAPKHPYNLVISTVLPWGTTTITDGIQLEDVTDKAEKTYNTDLTLQLQDISIRRKTRI